VTDGGYPRISHVLLVMKLSFMTYLLADCAIRLVCAIRHCRYLMPARVLFTPGDADN